MTSRVALLFKIVARALWREAEATGWFTGSPVDHADGFIHLSDSAQVAETAAKHFAGQDDLLLVAIAEAQLGDTLRWEPSRGGALFPHLYGPLDVSKIIWAKPLGRRPDGSHDVDGALA